jgi:hypothetical protein
MIAGRITSSDIRELAEIPDEHMEECLEVNPIMVVLKSPEKITAEQVDDLIKFKWPSTCHPHAADNSTRSEARKLFVQNHHSRLTTAQIEGAIQTQTVTALRYCMLQLPPSRRRGHVRRLAEQCISILEVETSAGTLPQALLEIKAHLKPKLRNALMAHIARGI